jgi:hypothetical protein
LGSMHSRQGQAMRLVVTERSLAGAPNTLSLPHPGFANPAFCLSPTLSLFQPLSFHVHAPLHHGCKPPHSLPFSCLHFRHGNGTWNMELGLGQSGDAFCATDRKESENQPTAGRLSLSGSSAAGRMIGQPSRPYPAFVCSAPSSAALGLRSQRAGFGWPRDRPRRVCFAEVAFIVTVREMS